MVLADDVTGDGFLDLLVSTMSGSVHLFGTDAPYHPANTWTSPGQGAHPCLLPPPGHSAVTPFSAQAGPHTRPDRAGSLSRLRPRRGSTAKPLVLRFAWR